MKRRVYVFFMVLIIFNFYYVSAYANPFVSIGANALKGAVRNMVGGTIVKAGVRTAEKSALKRAEERWFSRLAKEQVETIEKAAKRAEPVAGKKGWLKTAIGVGMWVTGVDLAFDIYDALNGGSDVASYTAGEAFETERVLGKYGIYVERIRYSEPHSTSFVYLKSHLDKNWYWSVGERSPNTQGNGLTMRSDEFPYLEFYVKADYELWVNTYWLRSPYPTWETSNGVRRITNANQSKSTVLNKYKDPIDLSQELTLVESNNYRFDYSRQPQPALIPNPYPDLFPGDDKAVEIIFPDPAYWEDPEQAIIENPDIVGNPNPKPDPNPDPKPDPNEEVPETSELNFEPLKVLGDTFTKKFPFSIPWDIQAQLSVFNVKPQAPKFSVDKEYVKIMGVSIPIRFSFDLDQFDSIAVFIRWFLVIAFDIGVILSMRRFMPE